MLEVKAALIVPHYNDWSALQKLLNSVQRAFLKIDTKEDWSIIVVDNNSSTRPTFDINQYDFVEWLICDKPGSYSARNMGIRSCEADYYFFVDSDCILSTTFFETAYDEVFHQASVNRLQAGNIKLFSESGVFNVWSAYDLCFGLPQFKYVEKGYAVTANLVVPRDVFKEVGMFDERAFSGGDADFTRRAIKSNFELNLISRLIVHHPCRATKVELINKIDRVVGAQVLRSTGFIGRLKIVIKAFLVPIKESTELLSMKQSLVIRLKAALAVFVLGGYRLIRVIARIFNNNRRSR